MKRIVIVGCSGSGKSTVAKILGEKLGLPVTYMDQIAFRSNWVQIGDVALDRKLTKIMAGKKWILEGNYGRTMSWRISKADTVLFLDFPRWLCLIRILQRVIRNYGKSRPDMAKGCPEYFDWDFMKWVWKYEERERPKTVEKIEAGRKGKRILLFRSPRELEAFLASL